MRSRAAPHPPRATETRVVHEDLRHSPTVRLVYDRLAEGLEAYCEG